MNIVIYYTTGIKDTITCADVDLTNGNYLRFLNVSYKDNLSEDVAGLFVPISSILKMELLDGEEGAEKISHLM